MKDLSFYLLKRNQIPISTPYPQFTPQTTKAGHTIPNSTPLSSPYFSNPYFLTKAQNKEQGVLHPAACQTLETEPKAPRVMKPRDKVILAICLILTVFVIVVYYARKSLLKVALGLKWARQVEVSAV